jgi:hypothetical protein
MKNAHRKLELRTAYAPFYQQMDCRSAEKNGAEAFRRPLRAIYSVRMLQLIQLLTLGYRCLLVGVV